jgi:IMP dehydrogenase
MNMAESFGFESVGIKQKKNQCLSRLDAVTKSEIIKGIKVEIPLIASNMSTVINATFYQDLVRAGAFGFLHRALPKYAYLADVERVARNCEWVPVSIGVGNEQYELANTLIEYGANVIVIDIAHGYCDPVIDLGRKLKKQYPHIKMVVGNTTNVDMLYEVADFADALKVGIASGLACDTKSTAGCFEKQFSAILKFKTASRNTGIPIISDGGLREPADLTKSIGAGASSAMAGSIFAACPESAAKAVEIDGKQKKLYAGMASEYVQKRWKGGIKAGTCAEGSVKYVDPGKPLLEMLEVWQGALRTGISYAGGTDIQSFQDCVEFIRLV